MRLAQRGDALDQPLYRAVLAAQDVIGEVRRVEDGRYVMQGDGAVRKAAEDLRIEADRDEAAVVVRRRLARVQRVGVDEQAVARGERHALLVDLAEHMPALYIDQFYLGMPVAEEATERIVGHIQTEHSERKTGPALCAERPRLQHIFVDLDDWIHANTPFSKIVITAANILVVKDCVLQYYNNHKRKGQQQKLIKIPKTNELCLTLAQMTCIDAKK